MAHRSGIPLQFNYTEPMPWRECNSNAKSPCQPINFMIKKQASAVPVALTMQSIEQMLGTIRIPPRPSLLLDMQSELNSKDPSPQKLSKIIGHDVAMAGALLKLANSAFVGLRLKARSVEQAVMRLGMDQCSLLLTGILAREAIQIDGMSLTHFWDSSTKRAQAMAVLAKKMVLCRSDMAHTFGLFSNVGVPLLMGKFPDYQMRLDAALAANHCTTTEAEDSLFNTNHAALGALMARTWGLPAEIEEAILWSHHYEVLQDQSVSAVLRNLVALSLLVDKGILHLHGNQRMADWEVGGELVCDYLGISQNDADDISDQLQQMFDEF